MIEIINKLWRTQKQLMQELGHEAYAGGTLRAMEMPVERVRAIFKMAQQPISMQSPWAMLTTRILAISLRTKGR